MSEGRPPDGLRRDERVSGTRIEVGAVYLHRRQGEVAVVGFDDTSVTLHVLATGAQIRMLRSSVWSTLQFLATAEEAETSVEERPRGGSPEAAAPDPTAVRSPQPRPQQESSLEIVAAEETEPLPEEDRRLLADLEALRGFVTEAETGGGPWSSSGSLKTETPEAAHELAGLFDDLPEPRTLEERRASLEELEAVEVECLATLLSCQEDDLGREAADLREKMLGSMGAEAAAASVADLGDLESLFALVRRTVPDKKERSESVRALWLEDLQRKATVAECSAPRNHIGTLLTRWAALRQETLWRNSRLAAAWVHRHGRGFDRRLGFLLALQGLERALDSYESGRSELSTYATQWIRQVLQRARANHLRPLRVPVHAIAIASSARTAFMEEWQPCRHSQDVHRDALKFLAPNEVKHWHRDTPTWRAAWRCPGTGSPIEDTLLDSHNRHFLCPSRRDASLELSTAVDSFLTEGVGVCGGGAWATQQALERELEVLRRRLGFGSARSETLEAIGESMGVTRERIRQIQTKALRRIRQAHGDRLESLARHLDSA